MRVAIIPARGGSRRIPRKNIRLFHGKPIIAYSIETAKRSKLFDRILVSTDDAEIARVAQEHGAEAIVRPAELCADHVGTQTIASHHLFGLQYQCCALGQEACVIYATAPLMTVQDLHDGLFALKKRVARYAFAVGTAPLRDAGAFYWGLVHSFIQGHPLHSIETVIVPIPESRVCDINTLGDWMDAERKYEAMR